LSADEKWIKKASARYSAAKLVDVLEKLSSAERDMRFNANFTMLSIDLLISSAP